MGKALVHAVGNGAVVVKRGENVLHRLLHIVQAVDIQESFLLAGKRSVRQVFSSGRRAHRHRNIGAAGIGNHFVPRRRDFGVQLLWERRFQNPLADFLTHTRQFGHIFDVQTGQRGGNALVQAVVRQKGAVGFGGGGEAAGHAHAFFGKLADHFAQRGVLAAHALDIVHTQVFKPDNVVFGHLVCPSDWLCKCKD